MAPRIYRLTRRAESAAATRQRIVEATQALHAEQGVAGTSMKEIARRADVGIGTVYHHFPSYDDVVQACGAATFARARPPTAELLAGCRSVRARIERMVEEVFACYERFPELEEARGDRRKLPVLDRELAGFERRLAAFVSAAAAPAGARLEHLAQALTEFAVYRALTARGLSPRQAAAEIAALLSAALPRGRKPVSPRPRPTKRMTP